jgi:hypothetical protein
MKTLGIRLPQEITNRVRFPKLHIKIMSHLVNLRGIESPHGLPEKNINLTGPTPIQLPKVA